MPGITPHEIQALKELSMRQCDSLDIFNPLANQEDYFLSGATELLCRGGNRSCVEGTILWKVNGKHRGRPSKYSVIRVEDIGVGDVVVGTKHGGGRVDIQSAAVESIDVYPESTYRLVTKRGYEVEGTHDHPVFACPPLPPRYNNSIDPDCKKAEWKLLRDVPEGWYVRMAFGSYMNWEGEQDDEAYFHGLMDGDGSVESKHSTSMAFHAHQEETLTNWVIDYVQDQHESPINMQHRRKEGLGLSVEWCSRSLKDKYLSWEIPETPEAMSSYIRGMFDADGHVSKEGKVIFVQKDGVKTKLIHNMLLLFGIKSSLYLIRKSLKQKRPNPIYRLVVSGCSVPRYNKSIGFNEESKKEKLARLAPTKRDAGDGKLWWDRVASCGPTGEVKNIYALSTSLETYISNGIVSHNSGKSTCAAVKFAAIARDRCVNMMDGRKVRMRRKYQRGKRLRMWVIAYDAKYIGQTIHRLLFEPGLFKIIRDPHTGEWVTYKPRNPDHLEIENEKQDSPPLIPSSWIVPGSWNWDNFGNKEFARVSIAHPQTGEDLAEIFAYSSKADPKAGDPVDHIWIDEKIKYPKHYGEWQARILDRKGRMDWSSWPAVSNSALTDLTKRARRARETGSKRVQEVVLRTDDNETFEIKQFKEWASGFSPEEYIARVSGEYQTDGLKMYPLFSKEICSAIIDGDREDDLSKELRQNGFEPPEGWTRELVLDPGTTNPAVIFCAIPPPYLGNYYVVYDEICIPRLDAKQLAARIKGKMGGGMFERFIIDPRAARQTPMGFSISVMRNYSNEFEAAGVFCRRTGSSFTFGSDNIAARIQVLQEWTHIQSKTGLPKLRIVVNRCPTLCEQMEEYEKQLASEIAQDFVPAKNQTLDAAVCLEYFASRNPQYVMPMQEVKGKRDAESVWKEFQKYFFRRKKEDSDSAVIMGPPTQ